LSQFHFAILSIDLILKVSQNEKDEKKLSPFMQQLTSRIVHRVALALGRSSSKLVSTKFATSPESSVASAATAFCSSSSSMSSPQRQIVVDPFAFRQFVEHKSCESYSGTVFNCTISSFEEEVNRCYDQAGGETTLVPGYASFCKHIFIKNTLDRNATVNVLEITSENESCLRSVYEARSEQELPVLSRYFPKDLVLSPTLPSLPAASYIDCILYSREQITIENAAMTKAGEGEGASSASSSSWGIVSIKAQNCDTELPMQPITAMRNALGKNYGGSGRELKIDDYTESVKYWSKYAIVK
jgi:hypothetical protein